jgi:hypothetical protein
MYECFLGGQDRVDLDEGSVFEKENLKKMQT